MSGLAFGKKNRLLNAGDYQSVFRRARYKVSSKHILILAIENRSAHARLGLVVGKKHIKLAVQRNRFKRLARESFRHQQQALAGLDIIILVRGNLSGEENARIRQNIDTLWLDLIRRRERTQPPGPSSPPQVADKSPTQEPDRHAE